MFFWNSLAFSVIQRMLAIWYLVPLPFLNPVLKYIWKFLVQGNSSLKGIEHYLARMWNERSCIVVWTVFGIVFLLYSESNATCKIKKKKSHIIWRVNKEKSLIYHRLQPLTWEATLLYSRISLCIYKCEERFPPPKDRWEHTIRIPL